MKKTMLALALCSVFNFASADPQKSLITFSNGLEGWQGVGQDIGGSWIGSTPGKHGSANYTVINNAFGVYWKTDSNKAFLGNYSTVNSVKLGLDVKADSITYYGNEVSRKVVVELRDYDNPYPGMPYTSVWFVLGEIDRKGGWKHFEVTIADTKSKTLPKGWGGFGYEGPALPPNKTFADVLSGVDEVVFSTFVPGYFYGFTTFNIAVDNIFMEVENKK